MRIGTEDAEHGLFAAATTLGQLAVDRLRSRRVTHQAQGFGEDQVHVFVDSAQDDRVTRTLGGL